MYPGAQLEFYFEPNPTRIFAYLIQLYLKVKIVHLFSRIFIFGAVRAAGGHEERKRCVVGNDQGSYDYV